MARTRPTRPGPITVAGENCCGGASGKRFPDPDRRSYVVYLANSGQRGLPSADQVQGVGAGPVRFAAGDAALQLGQAGERGTVEVVGGAGREDPDAKHLDLLEPGLVEPGQDLGGDAATILVEQAQRLGEVAAAAGPQGEPVAVEEGQRE